MGSLLSCLDPMKSREVGIYRKILTEDNSDSLLQNMRTSEDVQNNSDMYGLHNLGFREQGGTFL